MSSKAQAGRDTAFKGGQRKWHLKWGLEEVVEQLANNCEALRAQKRDDQEFVELLGKG